MKWLLLTVLFVALSAQANPKPTVSCVDEMHRRPTEIVITEKALKHILQGDFGQNPTTKRAWLKGGMHTYAGLEAFMAKRDDIFELGTKKIEVDSADKTLGSWYFVMQNAINGVGHVRLPNSAFNTAQKKSLLMTDINHNGGYLWKTLFPRDMDQDELEEIIKAVFQQGAMEDKGWALLFEAQVTRTDETEINVKIAVDKRSGRLISAYPAFNQPHGIHGPTGVQKGMMADNRGFAERVETDSGPLEAFVGEVSLVLNTKVHEESAWRKKNFRAWKKMGAQQKLAVLDLFDSPIPIDQWEQLAEAGLPNYEPNALPIKILQIFEAFARDPSFDTGFKLSYFLGLISNQRIFTFRPTETIIFNRFLLKLALDLAQKSDFGMQKFAIRVIEQSPIYWLLQMPFQKGMIDVGDQWLSTARVIGELSHDAQLRGEARDYDGLYAGLFEYAQMTEDMTWSYFKLIDEIDRFEPGFSTEFFRYKFMVEFVNMLSLKATAAQHSLLYRTSEVAVADRSFSQQQVYPQGTSQKLLRKIRQHSSLLTRLLFADSRVVEGWLEFVEVVMSFDPDRFRSLVEREELSFEEEVYDYFEQAKEPGFWGREGSATFVYPLLMFHQDEDKSWQLARRIYFIDYQRSDESVF
ncbi:MAG: hypothetical protein HRT45_05445 [Bdellovibrionales bacterium]|nr:hypothetical protein [Bdellovibrionales bacterium]